MRAKLRAAVCGQKTPVRYLALTLAAVGCGTAPMGADERAQAGDASLPVEASLLELERHQEGLTAGTFTLRPKGNNALCLDVTNAGRADGTRVQVATCNGNAAQNWTRNGDMLQVFGDKCLNVTGGSNRNGTRLQIWSCNARDINNSWTFDGPQLKWKKNPKLCLDVVDNAQGKQASGNDVQVWACDPLQTNYHQLLSAQAVAGAAPANVPTQGAPAAPAGGGVPASGNAASAAKLIGPSPQGLDVSPYFWTWAQWGDYPVRTLKEGMEKVALKSATIAFELSNGSCKVNGNFAGMGEDIKAFRRAGNRVILSFGGATDNPPYLQKACKDATSLANVIGTQIDAYDSHNLDFDIEGDNLGDTTSNVRLIDALSELQQRYRDLYVSYTLPVDAYAGLPSTAIDLLKRSIAKGVAVSRVNLMTMDYGQMPPPGKSSADMVIGSVEATVAQLKKLYPAASEASIYRMVGITPLIGQNDPPGSGSFYFTVNDAQVTAKYAKNKGIGLLSYWGLMRDRSGSSSSNANHSNTPQKDFAFLQTFRAVQ